jgi:stress response protein YsnF
LPGTGVPPPSKSVPSDAPGPLERLPVVEERLRVETERREIGALRVRIETEHRDASVRLERLEQQFDIERVRVDRPVDAPRAPWTEGDTVVVPVYEEVPTVVRRLVLVEELRLHRRTVRSAEDRQVPLRQERAVVERREADGTWTSIDVPDSAGGTSSAAPSGQP